MFGFPVHRRILYCVACGRVMLCCLEREIKHCSTTELNLFESVVQSGHQALQAVCSNVV